MNNPQWFLHALILWCINSICIRLPVTECSAVNQQAIDRQLNATFFLKPQAKWPTGPRGLKGDKGDPGEPCEKACYEDDDDTNGICNSVKYMRGAKLQINPNIVNNTICGTTIALRGPCFDEKSKITCIFYDPIKGPIQGEGYAQLEAGRIPTAYCVVPFLQDTGRITVDLMIGQPNSTVSDSYSGYLWTVMSQTDVSAVFMNCETNNELQVSWTAGHEAVIGAEIVDIGMHAFDPTRKIWINLGTLAPAVQNTGTARVDISKFRTMISESVVLVSVRKSVSGFPNNNNALSAQASAADCGGSIVSSFVHRVTSCDLADYCTKWFRADAGIPVFSENILPCPTFLSQAIVDTNFVEDDSDKVKLLRHFQPDAVIYRSRFGTLSGVGQQCVYDRVTGRLTSGANAKGSSANRYNPDGFLKRTLHYLYDVVPFMACCYGTADECELYYERRAISTHAYVPPHACAIWGDPHIATCDLLMYHFQGVGEFWLAKSYLPDGTVFFGQVRMEKWPTNTNIGISVSTAFAFKDGSSSPVVIQPAKTGNRLQVLVDGHEIPLHDPAITSQSFRGFHIIGRATDLSVVTIAFSAGMTFQINLFTSGLKHNKFLSLTAFVSPIHRGALKGLFGNFDGKPENDFITSDGTMIPAVPQKQADGHLETGANLAVIYWSFGMKWAISSTESLFAYPCGKSTINYFDPSFIPNIIMPSSDIAPSECIQVCGPSGSCLFDCVNVDIYFANITAYLEVAFSQTIQLLLQNFASCPAITSLENGFITGPYGGIANFGCDAGYSMIGPSAIQCANGTWSQPPPICARISAALSQCPPLTSPLNGFISSTDLSVVTFSCNDGYSILGPSTVRCDNGKWNSLPPFCVEAATATNLPDKQELPVAANMQLASRQNELGGLTMAAIEQLASGVDVDVDVNVNFNLPGGVKLAGIKKSHQSKHQ